MNLQFNKRPDHIDDKLYVITAVFNPQRYHSRWVHYSHFEKHIIDSGAHLITIEATFGNRSAAITEQMGDNHTIIHVNVKDEIWLKENLINVAIRHLPKDWKYVAWVDADLTFNRPDWVEETLHQLQHYHMVQLFSEILYMGPQRQYLGSGPSFMASYLKAYREGKITFQDGKYTDGIVAKLEWQGAPGGAWAATRDAIDKLGGLIDFVIIGSADYYMALCILGLFEHQNNVGYHPTYMEDVLAWQELALKYLNRNIGFVKGTVSHAWHGKMKDRGYDDRWKILIKHQFNPKTDLIKDSIGVYHLNGEKWQLRDDIRAYMQSRNEDSIDL